MPARDVGGDFYDWRVPVWDELQLTVGDIMGKGMAAALVMATVRAAIRSVARAESAETVVELAADALQADFERSRSFVTLLHAHLNVATQTVSYVNAGRGYGFVYRANVDAETLGSSGLPLGILPGQESQEHEIMLGPGDTLVIYSDVWSKRSLKASLLRRP